MFKQVGRTRQRKRRETIMLITTSTKKITLRVPAASNEFAARGARNNGSARAHVISLLHVWHPITLLHVHRNKYYI